MGYIGATSAYDHCRGMKVVDYRNISTTSRFTYSCAYLLTTKYLMHELAVIAQRIYLTLYSPAVLLAGGGG